MHKRLLRYILRLEFMFASVLTMAMVQLMLVISARMPDFDKTSFLDPIFDRIDFLNIADVSLDAIFAIKPPVHPDPRIRIVNVGEVAPTPDGMIALLIRKLHRLEARVVGVDVIFDSLHFERFGEERQLEIDALIETLHEIPNVVLVKGFDPERGEETFQLDARVLSSQAKYGFANLIRDSDGVVRRFLPRATVGDEEWLSLPIKMLEIAAPEAITPLLRLPAEPQILYYSGTYAEFESIPIADIVFGNMYDDGYFRDAIVLVGFVNEGGMFYLDDTFRTPMGRHVDIEGPDMPGVLIHANTLNMLLEGRFISAVPAWVDWLLVFLLAYISIAFYRVLRTKPVNRMQVIILITGVLFTEAVIVFFLPLIAFFYFDIKISYNLMATAVFLFIPANALTIWLRFHWLHFRTGRCFDNTPNPLCTVIREAFRDDEAFIALIRLQHAAMVLTQFAWATRIAQSRHTLPALPSAALLPGVEEWSRSIPEILAVCESEKKRDRELRYFFHFLSGKKDEQLRESLVRERYFITELRSFNEFVSFEEWELLLQPVLRTWGSVLRPYLDYTLKYLDENGECVPLPGCGTATAWAVPSGEQLPGVYGKSGISQTAFRLSPFCEFTECKLHRQRELFVFAGLQLRQRDMPRMPVYLGPAPNCEPLLPGWSIDEWKSMETTTIS
ncbi:MAG: CHASE2 domain-containing protein [Bacteroidetes bacterium]|nr:CHASE2 domain-containing protein [Bacteroidota bacterium]